jgi:hypothetical protein
MESLRERGAPTSEIEADAIGLLRSQGRYQPAPGGKQRVRARLLEHRDSHRRASPFFGFAVAAVLVFAVGTSVALGRQWVTRSYRALVGRVQPNPDVGPSQAASHSAPAPATAPGDTTVPSLPEAALEHPATQTAPPRLPASQPAGAGRARAAAEDDRLVFEAMRALRQDGQPDRASRSLDEYLKRHPDGELAEEALALSIEAASTRNDPRAKDIASRYLAKYPNGRFRSAAERARARFSP